MIHRRPLCRENTDWGLIKETHRNADFSFPLFSVVLNVCVTKVAKGALEKSLAENVEVDGMLASPQLPIVSEPPLYLHQPLIVKIDSSVDNHEK